MDASVEEKLKEIVETDPWWLEFINAVQAHQSLLAGGDPAAPVSVSQVTRDLSWAINTAAQSLDTADLTRKTYLLTFITESGFAMINFFSLLQEVAALVPINIKVSGIIREFVNPRNGSLRTMAQNQMAVIDPLQTLINVISTLQTERTKTTDKDALALLMLANNNTLWILSSLAQKDTNFAVNLRSLEKVKYLHEIMREIIFSPRTEMHFPCLKILRVLSKERTTATMLVKDKLFSTLKRLMEIYSATPSARFLIVFDLLVLLTKRRFGCKRFMKAGMLVCLMRAFNYWTAWKGRGLLRMSKCVVNIYMQLAEMYSGKKALLATDALYNMRKFCEQVPNDKFFDDVMMRALALLALAYGKHKLPFKDIVSPAKFDVPGILDKGKGEGKDSGTSSDEDDADDEVEPDTSKLVEDDGSDIDPDEDLDDEGFERDFLHSSTTSVTSTASESLTRSLVIGNTVKREINPGFQGPTARPELDTRDYEAKLSDFEHFFKELDGKISDPSDFFSNYGTTKVSVVIGLLGRTIAKQTSGCIPKAIHNYAWLNDNPHYGDPSVAEEMRKTYLLISKGVRSVIPFVKVAYPEITFAYNQKKQESLLPSADRFTLRTKLLSLMGRVAGGETFKPRVVYDLDLLLTNNDVEKTDAAASKRKLSSTVSAPLAGQVKKKSAVIVSSPPEKKKELGNNDEKLVGNFDKKGVHSLKFESRFECGNLRRATQVAEREYDLYLMSDVNSRRHNQWFYFEISNIQENVPFTFNVVNCIKANSQFNFGMQPVVYSVSEAMDGKPGWARSGTGICYYRNGLRNTTGKKSKAKVYHSLSFTLSFAKRGDIVYLAYHYPYSYSRLLTDLWRMTKEAREQKKVFARYDVLCQSLNQNEVPLLTITAPNHARHPMEHRDYIVLTCRVHPGEPNSSWIMHGILHQLLFGQNMKSILSRYVFKIVPMLNVEGVINGCGRCGLTDEDMNRRWKSPNPFLHASIYNTKKIIEYCARIRDRTPLLYTDIHGHSRRKNAFFYGCSMAKSWSSQDRLKPENPQTISSLPDAMARRAPAFSLEYCNFDVRKQRESTARVSLWREFGITRSYTLESSYAGCDRGPLKGLSLGIHHLLELGETFCEALDELDDPKVSASPMRKGSYSLGSNADPNNSNVVVNLDDPSYRYKTVQERAGENMKKKRFRRLPVKKASYVGTKTSSVN